jgi:hypothetical protein
MQILLFIIHSNIYKRENPRDDAKMVHKEKDDVFDEESSEEDAE